MKTARNIKPIRWRQDLVSGLRAVQAWLRTTSDAERAAVFGALQDEWCSRCGKRLEDGCKCVPRSA